MFGTGEAKLQPVSVDDVANAIEIILEQGVKGNHTYELVGPEIFTYKSFYLRTLAGIFLGLLYIFRGLGITVYTHIFYDMAIISMPVLMYNN